MKNQTLLVGLSFLLLITSAVMLAAQAQTTVQHDLDTYLNCLKKNRYEEYNNRCIFLQQNTPREKLMTEFADKGFDVLYDTIGIFYWFDPHAVKTESNRDFVDKCYEVAKEKKSDRLKRLAELLEINMMNPDEQYDSKMERVEALIHRCQKAGDKLLEVHCLHYMFFCSYYGNRPAACFAYASRLADALNVLGDDYPLKRMRYIDISVAYYGFRDLDRFYNYFHKALDWIPKTPSYGDTKEVLYGLNHLANYHLQKGNKDSAAYYYRSALTIEGNEIQNPIYFDIAICDLGYLELEKGNYEGAYQLLLAGVTNMKGNARAWDYIYGVYTGLGECLLAKGDLPSVKEYISKARSGIYGFPEQSQKRRLKDLYALENKYYARLGQHKKAALYLDSALQAARDFEQLTSKEFILKGEQQLKEAEAIRQGQEEDHQRKLVMAAFGILAIIALGLTGIVILLRKRNAAYKALARRAVEWARQGENDLRYTPPNTNAGNKPHHISSINTTDATSANAWHSYGIDQETGDNKETEQSDTPLYTGEHQQIMAALEQEMTTRHAYRAPGLTAEMLAEQLGMHRNTLSQAVNRATGNNFNHYVNSYRVKEAVRIMMETDRKQLYIEQLYGRVGFSNRTSFYRVFKQFTGLSPIEFQQKRSR